MIRRQHSSYFVVDYQRQGAHENVFAKNVKEEDLQVQIANGATQERAKAFTILDPDRKKLCFACLESVIGRSATEFVTCSFCEGVFHKSCLDPEPSACSGQSDCDWLCPDCVELPDGGLTSGFGFEEIHFRGFAEYAEHCCRIDRTFKQHGLQPTEEVFWGLVVGGGDVGDLSSVSTVYASDADSSTLRAPGSHTASAEQDLGAGFSDAECGSVLSLLGRNIEGCSTPWLYLGSPLSAFAWHNEDHYLYSASVHHWGPPKVWYGVPGKSAGHFEDCFRRICPDLFQAVPDLLQHLVTMIPPWELSARSIPVSRIIQGPGEIVVTFPQAYHCGFNMGTNCAEAVNFATSDWLPFGAVAEEDYTKTSRPCLFSYDEIVLKFAQHVAAQKVVGKPLIDYQYLCQRIQLMIDRLCANNVSVQAAGIHWHGDLDEHEGEILEVLEQEDDEQDREVDTSFDSNKAVTLKMLVDELDLKAEDGRVSFFRRDEASSLVRSLWKEGHIANANPSGFRWSWDPADKDLIRVRALLQAFKSSGAWRFKPSEAKRVTMEEYHRIADGRSTAARSGSQVASTSQCNEPPSSHSALQADLNDEFISTPKRKNERKELLSGSHRKIKRIRLSSHQNTHVNHHVEATMVSQRKYEFRNRADKTAAKEVSSSRISSSGSLPSATQGTDSKSSQECDAAPPGCWREPYALRGNRGKPSQQCDKQNKARSGRAQLKQCVTMKEADCIASAPADSEGKMVSQKKDTECIGRSGASGLKGKVISKSRMAPRGARRSEQKNSDPYTECSECAKILYLDELQCRSCKRFRCFAHPLECSCGNAQLVYNVKHKPEDLQQLKEQLMDLLLLSAQGDID
eukprot:gnl/MRDRNA2_/MRDRNA2_80768_c0_seq1.p1 gnl/MRDRNA2_/MRDRNA2_80768_c0~~gnl/MRDRNA2_/MRDRNA2_80768_c0_seq1.p1  ORF type:complete len:853 (+),score=142.75 gnl/MRDRNA2_/MRDRNA2_80768_c0_seq1:697-3255(+)